VPTADSVAQYWCVIGALTIITFHLFFLPLMAADRSIRIELPLSSADIEMSGTSVKMNLNFGDALFFQGKPFQLLGHRLRFGNIPSLTDRQ
jgi:hypothetical protein